MAKRERQGTQPAEAIAGSVEEPTEGLETAEPESGVQPSGEATVGAAAKGPRAKGTKFVKKTWRLPRPLARRIEAASDELNLQEWDLVRRLLEPQLKGITLATVPSELKALLTPKGKSAA